MTLSGNTLAKFDYELDDGDMIIEWDRFYYDDVQNTRLLNNTHDEGSQFAYDGAGRLLTSLRGVPTAEMGDSLATNLTDGDYDNKVEWVYDQVGSRLTQKIDATVDQDAAYDEINALTTLNASSRSRDTNGNFDPSTGGTYAYDYRNQLGKLSVHANGRVYEWHHDAFGRTIDRDLTNGSTGIRTYFDGDQIAERVSFNSAPNPDTEAQSREFVFGAGADELLLHIPTSVDPSDRYYAHSDQASSVQVLADETGAIQESYRYEEFGDPELLNSSFTLQSNPASIVKNPFRFSGRPYAQLATWDGEQWYDMRDWHYNGTVGASVQHRVGSSNSYRAGAGFVGLATEARSQRLASPHASGDARIRHGQLAAGSGLNGLASSGSASSASVAKKVGSPTGPTVMKYKEEQQAEKTPYFLFFGSGVIDLSGDVGSGFAAVNSCMPKTIFYSYGFLGYSPVNPAGSPFLVDVQAFDPSGCTMSEGPSLQGSTGDYSRILVICYDCGGDCQKNCVLTPSLPPSGSLPP